TALRTAASTNHLPRFGALARRGCVRRAVTAAFDGDANHTRGVRQRRTTVLRMSPARRRSASHDPDGFVVALSAMSANTRRAYEHDAREFVEWCERGGCTDASALDHRVLRRYLAYLQTRGFSRPSISRKAASVRAYVRHLRRRGILGRDVASAVQAPKGPRRLPRMPRRSEAAHLLDGLVDEADRGDDDPRARRDLAVVELLYGAGLRVSECCGLDIGDVDLRKRTVTVLGKGAKVRRVPLGEPARAALTAYLRDGRPALLPAIEVAADAAHAMLLNTRC